MCLEGSARISGIVVNITVGGVYNDVFGRWYTKGVNGEGLTQDSIALSPTPC